MTSIQAKCVKTTQLVQISYFKRSFIMNYGFALGAALVRVGELPDASSDTVDTNHSESYPDDYYVDCPGK